ncbi:MAG: amino acid ABC transporter substrate-binding protein [Acetobacteraceae bacterium]|nr:amino acid ABC transporter substrate-binding protein [Acetobacteraceae bacterium]
MRIRIALVSALAAMLVGVQARAQTQIPIPGPTIDGIKKRGQLVCGVDTGIPGFSFQDSSGQWKGFDVMYCRAIAAVVLNDANKVRFVPTTAAARFTILQSGEIDVLIRDSTLTMTRNLQLHLDEVAINFYAGQGFLVSKKLGVSKIDDLNGATICTVTGATLEMNIADYARSKGVKIGTLLFDKIDEALAAMETGRCDGYTDDTGSLAAARSALKSPNDWIVLEGVISKEPLGIHIRSGDINWRNLLFWIDAAMKNAEEFGVTKANVDEKRKSEDPFVRRLLGVEGGYGAMMGVDDDWGYKVIKTAGNYGELYDEFFGPKALDLARGQNKLWSQGGLHYPLPFR